MISQPKNILIKNVNLNYARLVTPVENPFEQGGAPSWELQAVSSDRDTFAEYEAAGGKVKEVEAGYAVSLRRKAQRRDGSPMEPVRVVDVNKAPMDDSTRRKIGNGSAGNVIVWAAPYEYMKKKGVTFSLTAVQVVDLVEYVANADVDFDMIGTSEEVGETPIF